MASNLGFLFAAYAVVWVAIFGYAVVLSSQIRQLREEVRLLREALERVGEQGSG